MKVLLALDNSRHSEYAIQSVLSRPWPDLSEFLVYCVFEPFHAEVTGWESNIVSQAVAYGKEQSDACRQYALEAAERVRLSVLNAKDVSSEVSENPSVSEAIVQKAADWQAELIIMGSHGRKGLSRFLLGSVSQTVVAHAPCSVEIVKRAAYSSN